MKNSYLYINTIDYLAFLTYAEAIYRINPGIQELYRNALMRAIELDTHYDVDKLMAYVTELTPLMLFERDPIDEFSDLPSFPVRLRQRMHASHAHLLIDHTLIYLIVRIKREIQARKDFMVKKCDVENGEQCWHTHLCKD